MSDGNACDIDASSVAPSVDGGLEAPPSAAPVYGDAYVTHFTLVLRTIARERPDFRRLYSPKELALAEHFLDRLTPLEQHVYARLFQRKGPWFKTASLLSYFTRRPYTPTRTEDAPSAASRPISSDATEDDASTTAEPPIEPEEETSVGAESVLGYLPEVADHRQVQSTLQTLVNSGLLLTPTLVSPVFLSQQDQDAHLMVALEAIQQAATAAELTALWKKLSGGKTKLSSSGSARTGSPLRSSKKTADSAKDATPSPSSNNTGNGTSKAEVFDAIKRLVMSQRRVDGSRIPVAKMMHAIWLDSYPLLQHRNLKDEILLVVRISDAARELFSRMHRLFYFQAAMPNSSSNSPTSMPVSARVKSFQQVVNEKSGASRTGLDALTYAGSGSSTQQWPGLLVIFKKVQYPSYKIIIRHPIFQSAETYICYEIASRLHRLMNGLEMQMVLTQIAKDDDVVPAEWVLGDDLFEHLPELTAFQRLILPPVVNSVPDEWQGRACAQFEKLLLDWKALDDLVLEVRKCLKAYSYFHLQAATQGEEKHRPLFFAKCNAGYHLSRVLHHATTLYEKQRQYAKAVVLLRDLLASPVFLVRKRAYWYERLALNCEHLKQHGEAKRVCEQALKDSDVLGAGLIAIQRRLERLSRRKDLQPGVPSSLAVGVVIAMNKRKIDHDEDDFVDLVSSSDEEVITASSTEAVKIAVGDACANGVLEDSSTTPSTEHYPQHFIIGRPLNKSTGEKSRFIGYDDEPCDVEQLVLQYYHTQEEDTQAANAGWYGVHCEGRVLINLFGLFLWDVLYAPVPDVFQSAYQSAPLDFGFAKVFYGARRDQIDKLLDNIEHHMTMGDVLKLLASTWNTHEGQLSRFVNWGDTLTLRFHEVVVAAMGQRPLARLLRHMATSEEFHRAQNGLPDLLMVRVTRTAASESRDEWTELMHHPTQALDVYKYCGMTYSMNLNTVVKSSEIEPKKFSGATDELKPVHELISDGAAWQLELKLVEVKGPRDRLSDQQERWLQLFNRDMGIDASVMHVVEEEKELAKRRQRMNGGDKKTTQTLGKKEEAHEGESSPAAKLSRRS